MLPRDLPQPRDGEENLIRDEGHAVDSIIRRVQERGAAVSFFVLDACRDNPFAATGVRSIGASRGLAKIDTPKGVFVLFSAGIGQSALDRLGDNDPEPNSVFTRKLVPALRTPGLTQIALAKRVQREVDELAVTIRHPQQPAFYDQIIGEIELVPGSAGPAPQPQPAPPAAAQPHNAAEIAFWTSIQNSKEAAPFEAYLTQFPSGSFAALARLRLEQISATQAQAVARAEPAPPPPAPLAVHHPAPSGADCSAGSLLYCVSSVLPPAHGNRYGARNLIDGANATAGVEGVGGQGIGEWFLIEFDGVLRSRDSSSRTATKRAPIFSARTAA